MYFDFRSVDTAMTVKVRPVFAIVPFELIAFMMCLFPRKRVFYERYLLSFYLDCFDTK